jgi:hypothetical protein
VSSQNRNFLKCLPISLFISQFIYDIAMVIGNKLTKKKKSNPSHLMFFFAFSDLPSSWTKMHWISPCLSISGVIALLTARGHYSIDVVIAYYITTRSDVHQLKNLITKWFSMDSPVLPTLSIFIMVTLILEKLTKLVNQWRTAFRYFQ